MDSSLQLSIEKAIAVLAATVLPNGFKVYAAHEKKNLSEAEANGDYLIVHSSLPYGDLWDGAGVGTFDLRLQLLTTVADASPRAGQVAAHQQRLGALIDLMGYANTDAAVATLNGTAGNPQFIGWDCGKPDDGITADSKQLSATLPYTVEAYAA
jgi:hypothetical protein